MRSGVAAIKPKKSCDIVAARESVGNKKPSRRSFRGRRARPRQRNAGNFVVSLPRGNVAAIKNLRGADFVAVAPGPGNETQEILLYCCRAGEWRRRKTFAVQFSLPPRQAPATRTKKSCAATKNLRGAVLVAAAPGPGDEN